MTSRKPEPDYTAADSDAPDPEHQPSKIGSRTKAVVRDVTGRRSGGDKGLPLVHEMSIDAEDGRSFHLSHPHVDSEVESTAKFVMAISEGLFAVCPICFTPDPASREHVPQLTLGGQVMTRTCHRCNNGLGSAIEAPLLAWYDNAFEARYTSTAFKGERRGPRFLHRQLPTGEFVLLQDKGRTDPEVQEAGMENLEVSILPRDMRRVRLAALKHAYLAACLCLGGIPLTDSADRIRAALLEARDANRDQPLTGSQEADRLRMGRTRTGVQGPPLALMATSLPNGETHFLLSLAGTLLISWPFDDLHPNDPGLARWLGDSRDIDPTSTPRPASG
jgi:hypothetical protein